MPVLAKDLRNAVIHKAIQGKLTKQNDDDNTVLELLNNCKSKKKKLIENKNIKKEPELVTVYDEYPFDIPNNWLWCKLGELITYQNGYSFKPTETTKTATNYPVIKSQNIMTLKTVIGKNNDYIKNPTDKMLNCKINKGDLLMCLSSQSSNPEPLGNTAIYDLYFCALLNQRVLKMTCLDEKITKYLYLVLNSEYFHYGVSHQGNGLAQANLKLEHVREMLIPLPPIEEQARIVTKVDELMSKIDEYEKLENELVELKENFPGDMKDAILQAAMEGKLTDNNWNEEDNAELYKPLWKVTAWDKKFKSVDRKKQAKIMDYYYYLAADMKAIEDNSGDVFLLSTGEYKGWTTEEKAGDNFRTGEIVSIPWGGTPNIKYYKGKFITSDNRIATSIDTKYLLNKYLYYFMLSQHDYLDSIYRGTGLRHPDMAAVLDMRIPLPSIDEQQRIVDKLDKLIPLCEGLICD